QRRMASLVGAPTVDETLTEDRVKELVAAAAGISNADWIIFASASEPPTPDMLENRSLSLILFGMPRSTAVQRGDSPPKASNEFEYLTEGTPKPAQLAQAMWVSKSKGYASLIQPEYVTNVTVNVAGDAAYGKVAFEKRGLYRGLIGYVARRSNGDWRIEEFHLPDLGMALECGDDGIWGPMVRSVPGDTPEVEDDDQPEWTSLFNGHDLTGWKTHDERPSNWMVEDGVLVGRGGRLFSERGDYQDFHFRAEVRLRDGANAGVNFRSEYGYGFDLSEVGGNGMVPIGYEVELVPMSETGNRYPSGSILRAPPGAGKWVAATKDEVQADTWFTLEIVVRGSRMTTKIDGAIVAETEEQDPLRPNGHFVLSAMQPLVEFRRIEVRSRSPDPTSVSNLRPRPRDRALIALRLVADRDGARASASVHIGQRFETIEQPSDLRELLRGEVHDATIKGAIQVDSKLRYEFFKSFIVPLSSWVNARTTSNNSIPGELRPIKASTLLDDESPGASIVLELSGSHERFVLPLSPFSESSRADLDSRPPARVRLITRPSKQVGVHLGKLDLGVGNVAIRRLDQELSRKTQLFASPVERLEIELDTDDSVTVADFAQVLRVCQLRRKAADEWERRATLVMIDSSEMPVDEFTSVLSLPVVD
ncbi:MAG: DUF1080 domain-containing protein, partial [Planctomycetaceae bacterium]|nr:DUF1080 domain-containing protein [Planctomycetaceae bacterium]